MSERFAPDILAELQTTTPLEEQYQAAVERYDSCAREIARLSEEGGTDEEWERAKGRHCLAEINVVILSTKIQKLVA